MNPASLLVPPIRRASRTLRPRKYRPCLQLREGDLVGHHSNALRAPTRSPSYGSDSIFLTANSIVVVGGGDGGGDYNPPSTLNTSHSSVK